MIEHTATRYHPRFAYYSRDAVIGASLKEYGEYAQIEVDFLLAMLCHIKQDPLIVYDIGGNIGYHATAFASMPHVQVHSFEPNPLNYAMLRENTNHLVNVNIHRMAISDRTGQTLVESFDPAESSNFGEIHIEQPHGVPVPCSTLDDLVLPRPHAIKIDVEGFEWEVLAGASRILEHRPFVYYEAQTQRNFDRIHNLLTGLDYGLYWATVRNFNPDNFKQNTHNIFSNTAIFNVIALPKHWGNFPGTPVTGPDDCWQRLCA